MSKPESMTFRLSSGLAHAVRLSAAAQDLSITDYIVGALEYTVGNDVEALRIDLNEAANAKEGE